MRKFLSGPGYDRSDHRLYDNDGNTDYHHDDLDNSATGSMLIGHHPQSAPYQRGLSASLASSTSSSFSSDTQMSPTFSQRSSSDQSPSELPRAAPDSDSGVGESPVSTRSDRGRASPGNDKDPEMRSCSQEAISGSRDSDAGISESGPGSSGVQQSVTGRDGKPSHSYIALISMAILSSPERKMLLGDIYNYITSSFPYYNNKEKAWRNSIRHNLSLNECFVKTGRSDTGKGHFWTIHQNCIEDFARGDFRRRQARRRARRTPTSTPFPFCFSDGGLVNENPFNFGAYYSSSDFFTGRMSDIAPKFPPVEVDNSQYTTSAVGLGRSVIGSAFSPHVLPDAYPAYSGPMSLSPSKASLAPFPAFLSPLETHRPMAPSCLSDHSVHSQSSSVSTPTSASSAQQFVFPRDHGVPSWYQGLPPVSYQCTSPREEPVFCSTASSTPSPPRLDSTFRITGYPSSGTPDPPNVVTSHSAGPDTLKNLSGVTPGAMPGLTPPYSSPTGSSNTAGRTQAMSPDSGTPMSSPGEDTHTVSWLPTSSRAAAALGFDEPPRVPVYDPYVVNPMTASYRGYGPAAANMVQTW